MVRINVWGVLRGISVLLPLLMALPSAGQVAFEKVMTDFAKANRVTILTESQPLQLDVTEENIASVRSEAEKVKTVKERLVLLAQAFDYSVADTPALPTLFVLHKKYSNPEDLPDITFEEARLAAKNIRKATKEFEPELAPGVPIWHIYNSLSPEAKQKMSSPQGIPVSQLSPTQQRRLFRVACTSYFRRLDDWRIIEERLDGCRSPKAQFTYRPFSGLVVPIYEGPQSDSKDMWFVALNFRVFTQSMGGTTINEAKGEAEIVDNKLVLYKPDPTDPKAKPKASFLFRPVAISLQKAVANISTRLPSPSSKVAKAVVDSHLQSKKICLFGEEFTTPVKCLDGLAAVYGLRIVHPDAKTARITMQVPYQKDISEVKEKVQRLLPLPIVHIFEKGRASRHFMSAVRELRSLVEPELAQRNPQVLPINESSPRALDLIGISSLLTCEKAVSSLPSQPPPLLRNFAQAKLRFSYETSTENPNQIRLQYNLQAPMQGLRKPLVNGVSAITTVPKESLNIGSQP